MNNQEQCHICNGTLINPTTGNQCSCVIKASLKKLMHPVLLEAKPLPKSMYFPLSHLKSMKAMICTIPKATFNSLAKYFYTLGYITNGGRFTHIYTSGKELIDTFLSSDEQAKKSYAEVDVLFIILHTDPENSYMSEVIPYLVDQRASVGKVTWINTSQKVYGVKSTKYKGMIDMMLNENIIGYVSTVKPKGWGI